MTPPTWLDAQGRRRPTLVCWTRGPEVAKSGRPDATPRWAVRSSPWDWS